MTITLSNTNWQNDKSTKEQRQLIDAVLRRQLRLDYKQLLEICNQYRSGDRERVITDIGQLTKGEASKVIDVLKGRLHN